MYSLVGKLLPVVASSDINPPIRMLRIVSHWVESSPELFSCPHYPEITPTKLPLLHPRTTPSGGTDGSDVPPLLRSPITGIIQWCVLAPMVNHSKVYSRTTNQSSSNSNGTKLVGSNPTGTGQNSTGIKKLTCMATPLSANSDVGSEESEENFQQILAQLHAELLSALLSVGHTHSSSSSGGGGITDSLNSDDVARIVAALIAFSQKQGGEEGVKGMEESVERLAQFLQISLSAKALKLEPGEVALLTSFQIQHTFL